MNNLLTIVSFCLLYVAVHCTPVDNEVQRDVLSPDGSQHSTLVDLNKEKIEILKKQLDDLGKSLSKLSETYRPTSESVPSNYHRKDGVHEEDEEQLIGNNDITSSESIETHQGEDKHTLGLNDGHTERGGGGGGIDNQDGTKIETTEGDMSINGKLNTMSVEQLELEEQLLLERLETLRNEKRGNLEVGFDPMAHINDVKSSDLVRAAPNEEFELPKRDDSSGKFVGESFAPEELGAVKDFQENENRPKYDGNEESPTEVSNDEKKSDCSSMGCLGSIDPVCGTDGKTYANECKLTVATCKDHDLKIRYKGECKTVPDVLITALMSDIQLLLDNGLQFDEIHKLIQDKRNTEKHLINEARQKNEQDYSERQLNDIMM